MRRVIANQLAGLTPALGGNARVTCADNSHQIFKFSRKE